MKASARGAESALPGPAPPRPRTDSGPSRRLLSFPPGLVLAALVLAALAVRAHGITERTFTHPEMHVPRMEVPGWANNPPPRDTLERTIGITVERDIHPPGFYLLMWLWTGLFGTGLFALRIPLVVASAACVPLAYRLASRDDGRTTALLTATLVAFHGHLIFFSQLARSWGWVVFLGLLSAVLLRELEARWRGWKAVAYVLVVACGLWIEHTFWIVFAAHGLWIVFRNAGRHEVPPTLRLQGIAAALGSPGLLFLWIQFGRGTYLDASSVAYLAEIARLNRIVDTGLLRAWYPAWGGPVTAFLTLAGGASLIAGILLAPGRGAVPVPSGDAADDADRQGPGDAGGPRGAGSPVEGSSSVEGGSSGDPRAGRAPAGWIAHLLAVLAPLLLYVPYGHLFDIPWVAVAGVMLAAGVLGLGMLVCATWRRWRPIAGWIAGNGPLGRPLSDLSTVQLVFPVAAIFALSPIRPLLASRTFLVYTPFILLLVSRSVARWARSPGRRVLLAVALVPLLALSVYQYETLPHYQHDYKTLVERMEPFMMGGDLVVLRNTWWAQPLHYHLPASARPLPPARLGQLLARARGPGGSWPRRIWVVAFGDEPFLSRRLTQLTGPLEEYRSRRRVSAYNCTAVLFELDYARVARTER